MALLDLSLVSKTLLELLRTRIRASAEWPSGPQPDGGADLVTSPAPPDLVTGDRALSLYLYHLREDAHTKAQDWEVPSGVPVPQRFKPMGITLYYMLCPKSSMAQLPDRTYAEQLVLGLAVKTLHDYPLIEDDTEMLDRAAVSQPVLDSRLRNRGNRLRIALLPTSHEEATQFWQAGSQPLRTAAYYEVSATLLEPESMSARRTRVSLVGVHPVILGQPAIEGTRNTLVFSVPGSAEPRTAECSPAEVPQGDVFEVFGANLQGHETTLLLTHPDFPAPLPLDDAWQVQGDGGLLRVTTQASIATDGASQSIVPGIYGALVRTTARRRLPDGSQRDFANFSNVSTLAITPRITAVSALAADGSGTITVAHFVPADLANGGAMLLAGADLLTRIAAGIPGAGEFRLQPSPSHDILFRLPAGIASGTAIPIRLVVRGAESAPRWVIAP